MKKLFLVASLALMASIPGQALASQTYVRTVAGGSQPLVDDFHVQPGGASSAASTSGAYSATASADFGVIKLLVDTPDSNGFAQATGSFQDTIMLSGPVGEFVPATVQFVLDGFVTKYNTNAGDWSYQITLDLSGTDQNHFQYVAASPGKSTSATGLVTIPVSATGSAPAGVSLILTTVVSIYSSGTSLGAFNLDFAHTALLTGIGVPDGVTVTSETYGLLPTNGKAFTYPAVLRELGSISPPSAVPEPASWMLMLVGFGMAGRALRSRRAALA